LDHGIAHEEPFLRAFNPQNPEGAKSYALRVPEAKVTLDRLFPIVIERCAGRLKIFLTSLNTTPAADADFFPDDSRIGARLFVHLQGIHRARFEAGRIRALMA
jgi:hypothetical protein